MSETMRVLYEAGNLGLGQVHQYTRTGIFRVVEATAAALDEAGCELAFCAVEYAREARRYLQTTSRLRRRPFYLPPVGSGLAQSARRLNGVIDSAPPLRAPLLRAQRKALTLASHLAGTDADIPAAALNWAEVYHSTCYAIPPEAQSNRRLARLQTFYDLIPLLHPEFTNEWQVIFIQRVLAGIGPEDWVLAISQSAKDDLCNHASVDPERVVVTYLAADPAQFRPCQDAGTLQVVRAKYGLPEGPYLLTVGTLQPRKNMEFTLRAFAQLVQEQHVPDLSLVLTGAKGWKYEGIFADLAALPGLRGRIIVTGFVDDADLAPLYSDALAFVYPSLYEGFGLPPLEAMQCGAPVITSNVSSLPEVVGDAGILVSPTDGDALCQALWDVYRQPALRQELAQRSLVRAGEFSWQRCASETIAAYQSALAERQ